MANTTTWTRTNYAGVLHKFARPNTLLSLIGGIQAGPTGMMNVQIAQTQKYSMGQNWTVPNGSQPTITEQDAQAGLSADTASRAAEYNVVQIFQKATDVSYLASSDLTKAATALGIGQDEQISEHDFQIMAALETIASQLNYSLMQGTYREAGSVSDYSGTRGIAKACSTNKINADSATLSKDLINQLTRTMFTNKAPMKNLVMFASPTIMDDVTALYEYQPQDRTVGGTALKRILTNFADLALLPCFDLADTEIVVVDIAYVGIVGLPVPDPDTGGWKGVLFDEKLSQVGAGSKHQVYGQLGGNYTSEKCHGMIYGLTT